ncbi:MAG: response regulator [Candidatus Competibacter denitrificans]
MINRAIASPITRALLIGVTVLSLAGGGWSLYSLLAAQRRATNQNELQIAAERYLSALKDVETGYRGYINVATEDFLEPYRHARTQINDYATAFKDAAARADLDSDLPTQMITHGQDILKFGERVIAARDESFERAQDLVKTRAGKRAMDKVREGLQSVATWVHQESEAINEQNYHLYLPVGIASLVALALAIGLFIFLAARAKRTTLEARSLLANVIERAPVGLVLLDKNLQINQANKSFARMVTDKGTMRAGEALKASAAQIEELLRGRAERAIKERFRYKDTSADETLELLIGEEARYFKADVFPVTLTTEAGTPSPGVGVVLNDFTRQRQAERELEIARDAAESANRAKSAFIANMSHELRTPLTAVLGYCELIEEDLRDLGQEAILTDVNKINSNARHLLGLINDVLDLSKIEAHKMDVHAIEFTVGSLLQEVEAATGSLITKNNNSLEMITDAPDTTMLSDDLKIKQVLLNLIGNAAKFTTDGKITVQAHQIQENGIAHTRFSVADTGIGMSAEQLANLFKRFSQADETTTRKYGGTGLGLALTKALSAMLGGRIEVASQQGEGTTFTMTIPTRYEKRVVDVSTDPATTPDENQQIGNASQRKVPSVLVVDDDPSARELLTRHLEREGFAVSVATSGAEALDRIQANRPLAVLLDVMMPGLDGWHVLRTIRDNPDTHNIPVIMQTVLNEQNFAYALGATGYLKKPIHRQALADALQSLAIATALHEVLIVDDDQGASERLKEMLQRDGWNCRLAFNGDQGLKALADRRPDLVLVDLIMPEMDGYAFIREVRKNVQLDDLPLVVMTAEDVQSSKVRSLAHETAGIVQKGSMPLADLVADLRRFAEQAKAP